ncbi:hypothetical protein M7784_01240 [Desulfovibrio aminophilus]|nr:hypothetical protein [Desulfovibrio aminophilus]MCM0753875.1 hypothetical protein [Desulfovibrio aminophilus]
MPRQDREGDVMTKNRDLDILEMPLEALAAYWLSLKKLWDSKKGARKVIDEEAAHTPEPYISFLLQTAFGELGEQRVRKLARIKRESLLADWRRKIELMRLALYAVASGENPRVTLIRMDSRFHAPPMDERRAFDLAGAVFTAIKEKSADLPTLLDVNHKQTHDRLVVKLLFYVIHARREGRQSLAPFIQFIRSPYFAEGLSLAVDGFDADFLANHLDRVRNEALGDARRKMQLSVDMALAIRDKLDYSDVLLTAQAYML